MQTLAQTLIDRRADLPTALGSADLRELDAGVLRNSLFSARLTNATAVQGLRRAITGILSGLDGKSADTLADARLHLKALGAALDYDPARGFPGDEALGIPPAEAGELRDLYSRDRLDFTLNTLQNLAQGAAKNIWGNEPAAREQYPAWELIRIEARQIPRGQLKRGKGVVEVPEDAWDTAQGRWQAAAKASGDDEALAIFEKTGRMAARKDSPIWQALGDGAGGYDDTLGNNYEPFAFGSGMGRVELAADEFEDLGGDPSPAQPSDTGFGPEQVQLSASRFDPDLLKTLKASLESGALKFRVKVQVTP